MAPRRCLFVPLLLLLLTATPARGGFSSTLPGRSPVPVVGSNQIIFTGKDDTLIQLARANGLGFQTLAAANPGVDPWLPGAGRPLLLPYSAVLPDRPQTGITVNLAELRLYLVWEEVGLQRVRIYPIGIGDEGWETPEGTFSVLRKVEQPVWNPPEAIRQERPELPLRVPPGPDNPLGDYWLAFTPQGHGLHGTHKPYGVGRRVSHGCLRLYPEDIRDLYDRAEVGTPVRIVYKPFKVGVQDGILYIEAHRDYRRKVTDPRSEIARQARLVGWRNALDWPAIERVVAEARGVPVPVSGRRTAAAGETGGF
ncbi:MAG TPA: L,D-transpeptidase family protein [Desulfuromonadales bacterium]|jgi:L,D-transpeptidase ErfK/SrfK